MDVFLGLPLEITRTLVDDWLVPAELVSLDIAYCNRAKREFWEKVLRLAIHFPYYSVPHSPDLVELYQNWVLIRQIPAVRLRLGEHVDCYLLDAYLQQVGGSVQEVTFHGLDDDNIRQYTGLVKQHCDSIVRLTCVSCTLHSSMITMMNNNPALLHLRIMNCEEEVTFW